MRQTAMQNAWANPVFNQQTDDSDDHRPSETAWGSKPCCITVGLFAGILGFLAAVIAGAVAAGILTLTTATSSTTTTSATTTTTTALICNASCLNQTWTSSTNLLSSWSFDGTYADDTATFNATPFNSPSFTSSGFINQALSFSAASNQSLWAAYMPLFNTSFTVELWLNPTGYPNIKDHSILGLCVSRNTSMCLHLTIRNSSGTYLLYMGFMNNDCSNTQNITLNRWIHAAFVFDATIPRQWVYVNGVLSRTCSPNSPIMVWNATWVTIGTIPVLNSNNEMNFFQGMMDELTVTRRAKSSCEVLERATLMARFPFNSGSVLTDSGPNSVSTTGSSYSTVSSGRLLQAISFAGTSSSYFQASGFTPFGINNQAFSFSLWLQPQLRSGSLIHLSAGSNGVGSWCISLMGFASNGTLVAQVYDGSTVPSVFAPTLLSLTSWTHVVQTWSSTNGLRLYVDNILVASRPSATTFAATAVTTNYITLGNGLSASGSCAAGSIGVLGPYRGAVDDFRIYSRELTVGDVCVLYSS